MHEAAYYEKLEGNRVHCFLCPHGCRIPEGSRGICAVRENHGGRLFAANYGLLTALSADPVEKKPLRHFMPGTFTWSGGSFGCNLSCSHCQNHAIAHGRPQTVEVSPDAFVSMAVERGCPSVAFTYNEPAMFFEWMADAARKAREKGLKTIWVTNGYISPDPLEELLPLIDAANIDLKAFSDEGYRKVGGRLGPVLHTIERAAVACHVEITMLLVPGLLDDAGEVERAAEWLGRQPDITLHLTRCFPAWQHARPPTDRAFMLECKDRAQKHLQRVYLGNV